MFDKRSIPYTRTLDSQGRKQCKVCQTWLPLDAFYRDRRMSHGRMSECPACISRRRAGKNTRPRIRDLEKNRARRAVEYRVAQGHLVKPDRCSKCGRSTKWLDAHHHNGYSEAHKLDIVWLCRWCHAAAHAQRE
jgi:hypothetical protein